MYMNFKDYFSTQSVDYAKYRPLYPDGLFEYLASVAPRHELAWDCATGNGQAAQGLARFFARVIATDASEAQLARAAGHERISYRLATAEKSDLEPESVDLITVAQALHWFDLAGFYEEVARVLKPDGVVAVWCYNLLEISPALDHIIERFYNAIVGPYWTAERRLVENGYSSLPFPFRELEPTQFHMHAMWSLADLLGYLRTWSATQKFIRVKGSDPVTGITAELLAAWGTPEHQRQVRWPLQMRIGVAQP